ncbi:MAG TPA: MarR family transcriptional regulator [Pseudonocardiaceae bacterium]|nr:MarR family transcriptional regulator [Pseudonocardiaceae bacterium]
MSTDDRDGLLAALGSAMQLSTSRAVFFHQAMAAHVGINVTDFNCLNILIMEGPLTVGGLAERCGLTKGGAITTSVDRLQKAGLVLRQRDPADRRKVIVRHTDDAIARIMPLLVRFTADWAAILNGYPDDELRVLLDYTERSNIAAYSATVRLQQA